MLQLSHLENTNPPSSTHPAWLRDGVSLLCAFSSVLNVQGFTGPVAAIGHAAAKFLYAQGTPLVFAITEIGCTGRDGKNA